MPFQEVIPMSIPAPGTKLEVVCVQPCRRTTLYLHWAEQSMVLLVLLKSSVTVSVGSDVFITANEIPEGEGKDVWLWSHERGHFRGEWLYGYYYNAA